MARISYVNGQYVDHRNASVHIEDRGFQFADSVYEVFAVQNSCLIDGDAHLDRLDRSLNELSITQPMSRAALKLVIREVLRRNHITYGALYLQVTRGQADRDFPFPSDITPTLVLTVKRLKPFDYNAVSQGIKVISIDDIRWKRCDIKTVSLLAGAMGKTQAKQAGAYEAWQVDGEGCITEGTSSNAWIVTQDGLLVTRSLSTDILGGITRKTLLAIAEKENLKFEERSFTLAEAKSAREAFSSSSTVFIRPIIQIDDAKIGDGKPGPFCLNVLKLYGQYMENCS
ncbi:MAG: D-amino acid aminotransferase [Rhodospirillaceae bacterium]|nr:MAG: D-amino acid aminotransferase [Rhodospirillaceae bacterium]